MSDGFDMRALALALGVPVVLVVGLRLGCINHALLSEQSILDSGASLLGWIGSAVDPAMARPDDNIRSLRQVLAAPCLGILPRDRSEAAVDAVAARVQDAMRAQLESGL